MGFGKIDKKIGKFRLLLTKINKKIKKPIKKPKNSHENISGTTPKYIDIIVNAYNFFYSSNLDSDSLSSVTGKSPLNYGLELQDPKLRKSYLSHSPKNPRR